MPTPRQIERRNRILTTAQALFSRQGYQETTLDQVARDSRVGKGVLYRYFGNKEDLLVAVFDFIIKSLNLKIGEFEATPPKMSLLKRYVQKVRVYLEEVERHQEVFRFFARMLTGLPMTPWGQGMREQLVNHFLGVALRRRDFIKRDIKFGMIRPCDPERTMYMIIGAVHAIIFRWMWDGCPSGLAEEAPEIASFLVLGLQGQKTIGENAPATRPSPKAQLSKRVAKSPAKSSPSKKHPLKKGAKAPAGNPGKSPVKKTKPAAKLAKAVPAQPKTKGKPARPAKKKR
jgi:AcrR family transcriptional regulator